MKIPLRQYWSLLKTYLRPQKAQVGGLALLLVSLIAVQLINPQIISHFIDAAQAGAGQQVLLRAGLLFLSLAILQQVFAVSAGYLSEVVAWTATNGLRLDLASHCLNLDLSFHNEHTPGEMIERLDGDVNNLSNFFSRLVIELLANSLLLVGVVVVMWFEDWRVGLGMTIFLAIALGILLRSRNVAVPYWKAEREASASFFGFLEERLAGTEDLRANGAEAYTLRNFHALIREMLRTSLKAGLMINILLNTTQFLFAVGTAAAFAIGAYLLSQGSLTIGTVYLIFAYTAMLQRPINTITHEIDHLQRAGAGIARIQELLAEGSRLDRSPANPVGQSLPAGEALAVQFDRVTFSYHDSRSAHPAKPV
ncbi:MAG: ABC transporter ATP-binding protein, partial [Anaerolineales bacterium]|nr:ABC transporter ATP-binding protein [Anaerolineales bacterium]